MVTPINKQFFFIIIFLSHQITCQPNEYRPLSGSQNNLKNPLQGATNTPYIRSHIGNAYIDGYRTPISGVSPRKISNELSKVSTGFEINVNKINQLHTYFAQLLVIDLTHAVLDNNGELITYDIPACDPIYDLDCLGNVTQSRNRVTPAPGTGVPGNPILPINGQTHYLDCSHIYGRSEEELSHLLDNSTGKLFLNISQESWNIVRPIYSGWRRSGDNRTLNESPPLASLSELFIREHNKLVDQYNITHPQWDYRKKFEEARRMVIALTQSIATREYMAATVGQPLPPYERDGKISYSEDVDPAIDIFFYAVAMRYGHSAVLSQIPRMDTTKNSIPQGPLQLRGNFWNPSLWNLKNRSSNESSNPYIYRGLGNSPSGEIDVGYTDDIRNHLFDGRDGKPQIGWDLFSLNIIRGRDLGIPDYNSCREAFGLSRKTKFEEITSSVELQEALKDLYGNVDSIDAIVGALSEDHIPGVMVGELIKASILDQFLRTRNGDKFWYENPEYFTQNEIASIHGTNLIDIILRNYPEIDPQSLPSSSFFLDTKENNKCSNLSESNLFPLIEDPPDFLVSMHLAPIFKLSWSINLSSNVITMFIQVFTNGWVGVGFDPKPNTMKEADIVLCRVIPDSGEAECRDSYALDVGIPSLDTDIGGTNDVFDVTVTQINGITTARFSRKLDTEDKYDKSLTNNIHLIYSFNANTNLLAYHGPSRSSGKMMKFISSDILTSNVIIMGVLAVIGILWSSFVIVLLALKPEHFRFQQPIFSIIILIGTLIGYIAVIILLPLNNNFSCVLYPWLAGISYVLVFASIFAKVYRIWRVIGQANKLKIEVVTANQLMIPVSILLLLEVIFLLIWSIGWPSQMIAEMKEESFSYICSSNHIFWGIFVGMKAFFLIVGIFLVIQTKDFNSAFNEAEKVSFSIYVMTLDIAVMAPVGFTLSNLPDVVFIVKCVAIVIPYLFVTTALFIETVVRILRKKDPPETDSMKSTVINVFVPSSVGKAQSVRKNNNDFEASSSVVSPRNNVSPKM